MTKEIKKVMNLDNPIPEDSLNGYLFSNENKGHKFIISCTKGVELQTLTGSVTVRFMRANNTTILLGQGGSDGRENYAQVVDGNAEVTLHPDCYNVPGRFKISVFNISGDTVSCIYVGVGTVSRTQNGELIDSGDIVPSIDELVGYIDDCITATENAEAAADHAVRYDVVQTLTDTQKAQARTNIDASSQSDVVDLKSAVESYPSHNLANFNYRKYDGIYPTTVKLDVTNLDTGVRLTAPSSITASRYIYFLLPISDFYGETLYFSATVTKGTDSVKPRFACRYWDGTSATAIVNSGVTASLEINVVDQATAETNGYTHLRFEFYITYTSASIVAGDYVDFTNVSIERKRHLSAYSYPDDIFKNSVVGKNQKRYIVDATTDLYFESYNNGVYLKFSGSLYLRGLLPYTTLRISYTGTSTNVRTFDDAYEVVESNAGVAGCIYIPNNYCAVYDFAMDKIVNVNLSDLDAGMFVIFAVSSGKIIGGEGRYIYDNYILSNKIAKLENIQLNDDWADDIQSVQIAQKKTFIFGVQTDTHYDPLKTYFTDGSHSGGDYAKQLAIYSRYVGMNFICNLGDIICGYASNTQADSREAMTDIVNRYVAESKCPVLFAVGNHDDGVLYTTSKGTQNYSIDEIITGDELYGRLGVPMYNTGDFVHGKELYYYIDFDDVRVIMLNTRDNAYIGVVGSDTPDSDVSINAHQIRSEQLAWFRDVLNNSTGKKIIVMSHVGLVDGVRTDTYGVSNADAVVSAIESFKTNGGTVIGVFSGHAHTQISTIVNGINYIGFDDGGNFAEIVMVYTDADAKTIKTKMVGDVPSGDVDREFSYT